MKISKESWNPIEEQGKYHQNRDRVNRHAIPEVNKYKVYELRMKNQKLDNENPVYKKKKEKKNRDSQKK